MGIQPRYIKGKKLTELSNLELMKGINASIDRLESKEDKAMLRLLVQQMGLRIGIRTENKLNGEINYTQ